VIRSVGWRAFGRRVRSRAQGRSLNTALATALGAAALVAADAANAQMYGYGSYWSPYYYMRSPRMSAPYGPYYHKPKRKPPEAATGTEKKDAEKKAVKIKPPPGPLLIAISLDHQRLTVYSAGAAIAHSPVSTGTPDHPTPAGIFSVIGKERFHRSNLYSNAPMPFMQRITWSGVALHQGVLPGYPASHGCIRLPERFAQSLWGMTRMGARVIITRDEAVPFEIAHDKLFVPRSNVEPEPKVDQVQASAIKVAASDDPVRASDAPRPARLGTADPDDVSTAQLKGSVDAPLRGTAANRAPSTATRGKKAAGAAGELSDVIDSQAPSPTAMDATMPGEAAESTSKGGRAASAESKETPRMSDPVSVFISRKTGRLYVRQGFEPQFETAVTIRDANVPLGTHLYTAIAFNEDRTAMHWSAVALPDRAAGDPERRRTGKKKKHDEHETVTHVPASARRAAAAALDRVEMPQDAVDRISGLLSPGASLIISDHALSSETGKHTDFIIETK
jgi:lipoprotein-anchoring transpeptidase ErfK/SrfK